MARITIPRDVADIVYKYTDETRVWGMTCKRYNRMYKESVNIDIHTKYIKNFARMCTSCGQVDIPLKNMTWDEKMTVGGYAYDMDEYDYDIARIDIDDPPVAIDFIERNCHRYVKKHGIQYDPFAEPVDENTNHICRSYIYFHGFNIEYPLELVERFRCGERYLFQQIIEQINTRSVRAEIQLWYNGLTHPIMRARPLDYNAEEKIKDKMMNFGIGFTWHTFGDN